MLDAVERRLVEAGARAAAGPSKVARALADRLATPPTEGTTETGTTETGTTETDTTETSTTETSTTETSTTQTSTPGTGEINAGETKADKVKIDPVLRYARQQRDDLIGFDPGVRQGDPEAVHKMRVATRRLRSTLKTFKRSFPRVGRGAATS